MHNQANIMTIDIGNTCTHLGLITSQDLHCLYRINFKSNQLHSSLIPAMNSILEKTDTKHLSRIIIASGNKYMESDASLLLNNIYGPVIHFRYSEKLPIKISYSNPFELGADRIADALYGNFAYPGSNLIIIDAGTAITADLMLGCDYRGGVILPGIDTQLSSLRLSTNALPLIASKGEAPLPGTSTEQCIRAGVLHGIAGALNHIIFKYCEQFQDKRFEILTTGGSWSVLENLVKFQNTYVPDLTLAGIAVYP